MVPFDVPGDSSVWKWPRSTERGDASPHIVSQFPGPNVFTKRRDRRLLEGRCEETLLVVEKHAFEWWRDLLFAQKRVPFYRASQHTLKVLSRLTTGLSDSIPLSSSKLYRTLVRVGGRARWLESEIGVTKEKHRLLWRWCFGMRYLNNDEACLTWRIMWNATWVKRRLFSARLTITTESIRCSDMEESIEHAFFHCSVSRLLGKLLKARVLSSMFFVWFLLFVLEASSFCCNVVLSLKRAEHCVSLLSHPFESLNLDDATKGWPSRLGL